MMASLYSLLSALDEGQIIERISIPPEQGIESILKDRDSDEFSARWMESFRCIESRKTLLDSNLNEFSTKIRELAYLKAFDRWKSPDLAAYISDDFGLIGDAITVGIKEPWTERLLNCYLDGVIPSLQNNLGTS